MILEDACLIVELRSYSGRAWHRRGDGAGWWAEDKIDPIGITQELWPHSRSGLTGHSAGPEEVYEGLED